MKTCTVCKKELDYRNYHRSKQTKDGYGYRCKQCDKKAREAYRTNNLERFAEVSRRKSLKWKYGITPEDYARILEKQNGGCGICGSTENKSAYGKNKSPSFSVDHCHRTGSVRGLLCNNCNRGLGLLGDTIEKLELAIIYLRVNNQDDTH